MKTRNFWTLKISDWSPELMEYQERYTRYFGSSLKARRAAIKHITILKNEDKINTVDYSKSFYTISADSGSVHCIIQKETIE